MYVQFKDVAGNWSSSFSDTVILDTVTPTISNVASLNITSTGVTLTWTTNEAATSQANYGQTVAYGATTTFDTALVTAHQQTITGLLPGTTYNYRVRSIDAAGNESISGNFIVTTLSVPDSTPPSVPTSLKINTVTDTQVSLSWATSTDNVGVAGYTVSRNGVSVATTSTTSFTNNGLLPSTSYSYTVSAFDQAGNQSGVSASVSTTTSAVTQDIFPPVVMITSPAASSTVSGMVTITANATDNSGVAGVQFLLNGTNFGTEVTSAPYTLTWDTASLQVNSVYTLSARARDYAGNIATSSPITVTITNRPSLGAHVLAWYPFESVFAPLVTSTTSTQSTGSTLLAWVGRGYLNTFSATTIPTDNEGNTFSLLGAIQDYSPIWPQSGAAMYVVPKAVGGPNHVFTTQLVNFDEVTMSVVEIKNAGRIQDYKINKVLNGSPNTSGTVTTTGPATLIAVWAGDGLASNMVVTPGDGFSVIDSQLINTTSAVQVVVASKEVATAGTYNVTWSATPAQGANMWLIAVQNDGTQVGQDTVSPTVPINLVASSVSPTQVNLSWSASTDNVGVVGYQVFRNGGTQPVATVVTPSYQDINLTPATVYSYTVRAIDAAGNVSGLSTQASATTLQLPDTTPPSTPINVVASTTSSTQINLTWGASIDNIGISSYQVFRNGGTSPIATVTSASFSDTGLIPSTVYSYTVRAIDTSGNYSLFSATSSATTLASADTTPPSTPTNVVANATSTTQIRLTWTASTDNVGVVGYQVFRNSTSSPVGTPTTNSYLDSGLTASTTYTYFVRASDTSGNLSAFSSPVNATTFQAPSDTTPPVLTVLSPSGVLSATTTSTLLSVGTNENATCALASTAGTAFASMTTFAATGGLTHTTTLSGLVSGTTYTYYVKCRDVSGNISGDQLVSFSVASVSGTSALVRTDLKNQLITESISTPLSVTTTSLTPPSNSLLVVSVLVVNNQSSGTLTVSGGGLTWTRQKTFTSPNTPSGYTYKQEVWTAQVTTGAPMTITVDGTGTSGTDPARVTVQAVAFTGYNTASPIGGTASGSSLGDAAATITLSSAPVASSIVFATRGTADNATVNSSATPGPGWTEVYDQATSAGYGDLQTMVRTNSTSTSVTWSNMADSTSASLWESSAFALEIKAAP